MSCVGRADGGGMATVTSGASELGSRLLPGADREMVNGGLKRQRKLSDTTDNGGQKDVAAKANIATSVVTRRT